MAANLEKPSHNEEEWTFPGKLMRRMTLGQNASWTVRASRSNHVRLLSQSDRDRCAREAAFGRILDGAVHPLDLTVRPGMLGLGQPMIDIVEGGTFDEGEL